MTDELPRAQKRHVILVISQVGDHAGHEPIFTNPQLLSPLCAVSLRRRQLNAVEHYAYTVPSHTSSLHQMLGALGGVGDEFGRIPDRPSFVTRVNARDTIVALIPNTQTRARPAPHETTNQVRHLHIRQDNVGARRAETPGKCSQRFRSLKTPDPPG